MEQKPEGWACCWTALLAVALLMLVLYANYGCAKRPETASPDYTNYLVAMDNIAAYEASVDRTIFTMNVGTEPVVLPPGTQMMVRAPIQSLPTPDMWRDFAYEAELNYYGTIWSMIGGVAIPTIGGMYNAYNNRKMITGVLKYGGSPTWNNSDGSTQVFSGGWGDRNNTGTGDMPESSWYDFSNRTAEPFIVEPVIVPIAGE